jgi:hypothetical protein
MTHVARRLAAVSAAVLLTLAVAGAALAAHPKAGKKYSGFTSEPKLEGFSAPVSFTVSGSATRLLGFRYASLGCFGAGGFRPGVDYFTQSGNILKVGAVSVSSNGSFSIKNAASSHTVAGQTTVTTTTVKGKFKSAKVAAGTITFTQKFSGAGFPGSSCGPAHLTFTAKTK